MKVYGLFKDGEPWKKYSWTRQKLYRRRSNAVAQTRYSKWNSETRTYERLAREGVYVMESELNWKELATL